MVEAVHLTPGVLAKDQLSELIRRGRITTNTFGDPEVGASAIDLRLGKRAWRVKSGLRPTTRELGKIQAESDEVNLSGGKFHFEKGNIYLVELAHHLQLPSNISGRATGKSSIGRLDVITRLITNATREYDLVTAGYNGPLHLLLVPQTFTIHVAPGASLNQLRLFCGSHTSATVKRQELRHYGVPFWWILRHGKEHEYEEWDPPESLDPTDDPLQSDLTVDLGDKNSPHVYRALQGVTIPIDVAAKRSLAPEEFFERDSVDEKDRSIVLKQGSFYIMKSRERLHIPDDVAVEVIAISERIGDIRIHYAGFAHPGFGLGERPTRKGTPLIFEVRATDMETKLYDASVLARIQLFRMSKRTEPDTSEYEKQELKLSAVFKEWT